MPEHDAIDVLRSECPGLRYLELPAEYSAGVEHLRSLEHLVLTGTSGPRRLDLSPFGRLRALGMTWSKGVHGWDSLHQLRHLSLHYCKMASTEFLGKAAVGLRSLTMKACAAKDFASLGSSAGIEFAWLGGSGRHAIDARVIARWRKLRCLHIAGYALQNLDSLILPPALDWLVLEDVRCLKSLRFLRRTRPRLVSLSGKKTRVHGDLTILTRWTGSCVMVDPMRREYGITKRDLPSADVEPPQNEHADPTGFQALLAP